MATCSTCKRVYTEGERFCPFDATELVEEDERATVVDDTLSGTVLDDRYKLLRLIGSGGMGRVFEAEHVTIMRRVAIKILRDSEADNPEMVQRFRQEAMSASKVGHPGIIQVLDFGTAPTGAHYMVMEMLHGQDLSQMVAEHGPVSAERLVVLLGAACEALEAAHHAGIVHRDLKPENLFLTKDEIGREIVKVLDFGLAKMSDLERPRGEGARLTKTGMIFGTPKYMSPEQARGRQADARSDVYAMGIIAYELLTGKPPFDGNTFLGVLAAHLGDAPASIVSKRPDVPQTIEDVVFEALAKEPDKRPQSMAALSNRLHVALGLAPKMKVKTLPPRLDSHSQALAASLMATTPRPVSLPPSAFAPDSPAPESRTRSTAPPPKDSISQRLKLSNSDVSGAPRAPAQLPIEKRMTPLVLFVVVMVLVITGTFVAFGR